MSYSFFHLIPQDQLRLLSSRPGEFRPEPLTEPDVRLSTHPTLRAIFPAFALILPKSSLDEVVQVVFAQVSTDAPLLHANYRASSLLRASPPLPCPSLLSSLPFFGLSSKPREFHPQPLTEPYVTLSCPTALLKQQ